MSVFDELMVSQTYAPVQNCPVLPGFSDLRATAVEPRPLLPGVERDEALVRSERAVAESSVMLQHALIQMVEAFGPGADEAKGTEAWACKANSALLLAGIALRRTGYDAGVL